MAGSRQTFVAVELDEVLKQAFDKVQCVGAISVSGEQHSIKSTVRIRLPRPLRAILSLLFFSFCL